MQQFSKKVTSNQNDIHEDLFKILKRNQINSFQRPLNNYALAVFDQIENVLQRLPNKKIIFDWGCGTGESTINLSKKFPENIVIGIDKSFHRLEKKNASKMMMPANAFLFRCDLIDFWNTVLNKKRHYNIQKQYFLYPNPWPKKKLLKRRFHASPIFKNVLALGGEIEVRSNWEIYIKEFASACEFYNYPVKLIERFTPEPAISPFEQKYYQSKHILYRVII